MNQPDTEKWEVEFDGQFKPASFCCDMYECRGEVEHAEEFEDIKQFIRETRAQEYTRGREDAVAYIKKNLTLQEIPSDHLIKVFSVLARASDISATE